MPRQKSIQKREKRPEALWFGHALKAARGKQTQVDLARELRIDDHLMISRWEQGRNLPSDENMDRLARKFPDLIAMLRVKITEAA